MTRECRENIYCFDQSRNHARYRSGHFAFNRFMNGMLAVVLIVVLSFLFGNIFTSAHGNAVEEPVNYKYYTSVRIEKGDTLWSIAEHYMSDEYNSIYDYMDELAAINSLNQEERDRLQAGTYLSIAYYDNEYK